MSFVWGEKNVEYLRKRHEALQDHPLFRGMDEGGGRRPEGAALGDQKRVETPAAAIRFPSPGSVTRSPASRSCVGSSHPTLPSGL